MLSEQVQGLIPVCGILELAIGRWDAWRDQKVVLTGHHHGVILLSVRHAPVDLPIPVDLELTSVHELVLSRVRQRLLLRLLLLLSILLQHVQLVTTAIILAVGA